MTKEQLDGEMDDGVCLFARGTPIRVEIMAEPGEKDWSVVFLDGGQDLVESLLVPPRHGERMRRWTSI